MSPWKIYSIAWRYDEFPGTYIDTGSSLRGAMKGWYKPGVCRADLWDGIDMPPAAKKAKGWWAIPQSKATADDGGHAFVIVGYTRQGFIIHNSWGASWGSQGRALLRYEDWSDHAMDCWGAQLGVATEQHRAIAAATSLRVEQGKVRLAGDVVLRDREISPFIINLENNGRLSASGRFRTQPGDVAALFDTHLASARKHWGLKAGEPVDIALYAHGGLTGEDDAAATAAQWIPALYDAKIFPIFLMWETDLLSTLKNRLEDLITGLPRPTAGLGDQLKRFWNQRVERLLARPGTMIWGEMKQNAEAISAASDSGGQLLYHAAQRSPTFSQSPVRLHLIGHSAGSIVHSHIVHRLCALGWDFETLNLMAPAVTVELFEKTVLSRLQQKSSKGRHGGQVRQLNQWHLTDALEQTDPTCKPILYYTRSLLYLVSESFEGGKRTPLLGMQKHWNTSVGAMKLPNVRAWSAPGAQSASATHGGFDEDGVTRGKVIQGIRA